jgi:hypothetical protein
MPALGHGFGGYGKLEEGGGGGSGPGSEPPNQPTNSRLIKNQDFVREPLVLAFPRSVGACDNKLPVVASQGVACAGRGEVGCNRK